jgi:hypothetical protein
MSGILGTHDLTGGVIQSIYQCDTDQFTTANISICNRHNVDVEITLAITDAENAFDDARYIEYKTVLKPKGVLERSAVAVPTEKYITIMSSHNRVSAVAYGVRAGDDISVTAITDNTDSVAPVWVTPAVFETEQENIDFDLEATDPGNVTYSISSGSLPTGVRLTSSGKIIGTAATGGPASVTFTATDESGNSSNLVATVAIGGVATGGTKTKVGGYTIHTFTTDDDFELFTDVDVEVLMVGGGGGGGGDNSGGGGAGGVIYYGAESPAIGASLSLTAGTFPITIGNGGAGSPAVNTQASNGGNTTFNGLTALGGGYGATGDGGTGYNGNGGGSGGGGASEGTNGSAGAANQPGSADGGYGNVGGNASNGAGGGGGGAGGVGEAGNVRGSQLGGDGGAGVQYSISGTPSWYAAGGNGGNENGNFNQRPRVNGIGGQTNASGSAGTIDAVDGTGSGGGGVTHSTSGTSSKGSYGSYGGSGIVVIRYAS